MLYQAFMDDSADRDRERVIISAAILGRRETWSVLNKAWNERLAEDGLQYFKSAQCKSLFGQFKKFRAMSDGRQRADKVRDDLDGIIRGLRLTTIGLVLPVPFHQTMLADQSYFGPIPSVPYELAFQQMLAECAKAVSILGRNRIVTFGHDDSADFHILHGLYKAFKAKNKRYAKVMADFVPLDDKSHPAIQAADVAAFVTYNYAEAWLLNPSEDNLRRLRSSMYKIVIWGPAQSKATDEESRPAKVSYVARNIL